MNHSRIIAAEDNQVIPVFLANPICVSSKAANARKANLSMGEAGSRQKPGTATAAKNWRNL